MPPSLLQRRMKAATPTLEHVREYGCGDDHDDNDRDTFCNLGAANENEHLKHHFSNISCLDTRQVHIVSPCGSQASESISPIRRQADSSPSLATRRKRGAKPSPVIDCALVCAEAEQRSIEVGHDPSVSNDRMRDLYDVEEELGQGSTGVVYAAKRREDQAKVALKVMRMVDEELLHRAQQEYELIRNLSHPHVIRALDFFTYQMGAVLVLEHFPGPSMEAAVLQAKQRRFDEDLSKRLFTQLIEAIGYLHEKGIIHRDVKPANALLSEDLTDLRLADFNTAKSTEDGSALTLTGTIDYLPPEVLLGSSLCEGSDVWAAGLCLHFMLSGALPRRRKLFTTNAAFGQAALQHVQVPLSGEQWQHLGLSAACFDVLGACLQVDVEKRATAKEVRDFAWMN